MAMPVSIHRDVFELLKRLGLKDREGRIYLACLQNKDGLFIHEITKATRVTRSTVDLTVKRLLSSGFLNKVKVGRRVRYMADAPEAILFRQRQLADDLAQIVPMLTRIGGHKQGTEVIHFEGNDGYVRLYDDILLNLRFAENEKKDLLSFSSGVDAMRLFPNMQKGFINKRIRNGSWFKAIASPDSRSVKEWISDPKALRAIKYLPKEIENFHMDTNIYGDSVMLYSPTAPVGGVVIRNAKIAEAMRNMFALVWSLLPEG